MIQLCLWNIHNQFAKLSYFQTKIHIIKSHLKFWIQSSNRIEGLSGNHQTGCCNRTIITRNRSPKLIDARLLIHCRKCMSGNSANPNNYACMLNRAILKIQPCTNNSYIFALTIPKHLSNKIR